MSTTDIDEHFGVTVSIRQLRGPARAEGSIYLRSDPGGGWFHKVHGEGRVESAAMRRAREAARQWVYDHGDQVLRERGLIPE